MSYKNSADCKRYMKAYFKSEYGVLKKIYHHMKERSKDNNWDFTLMFEDFYCWAYENGFKNMFDDWKYYDYCKAIKPSVDRIDDYGVYTFDNMQLITWNKNWEKGQKGKKNVDSYNKTFSEKLERCQYNVIMRNPKTDLFVVFRNVNEVLSVFPFMLRSKISSCCCGVNKTHHSFTFQKIIREVSVTDD